MQALALSLSPPTNVTKRSSPSRLSSPIHCTSIFSDDRDEHGLRRRSSVGTDAKVSTLDPEDQPLQQRLSVGCLDR